MRDVELEREQDILESRSLDDAGPKQRQGRKWSQAAGAPGALPHRRDGIDLISPLQHLPTHCAYRACVSSSSHAEIVVMTRMTFKVIRQIDHGGFGIVELVEYDNGKRGARKRYSPDPLIAYGRDPDKLLARFIREVRVQEALRSRAFLPVIAHELDGAEPWYLMPLADMNFRRGIDEARASGVVPTQALADILNGLEELHELGYVHRDLKPENILLQDGVWKLGDFGLILEPDTSARSRLTSTASVWGTLAYSSPEQAGGLRDVTAASDIYSFGCILHDVFDGSKRIPLQRHTCAHAVGAVIEKCTEPDPRNRFKDIRGLRAALTQVLTLGSTLAVPPSPTADRWLKSLATVDQWRADELASFVRFLTTEGSSDDQGAVLTAVDEPVLRCVFGLDEQAWDTIAKRVNTWAMGGFAWEFCDVLVRRLECIFELGSVAVRAGVAIATAELGASHNRWFVMQRLFAMCGPRLDDRTAMRVAVEIRAERAENNFRQCAEVISRSLNEYHPFIAAALT